MKMVKMVILAMVMNMTLANEKVGDDGENYDKESDDEADGDDFEDTDGSCDDVDAGDDTIKGESR